MTIIVGLICKDAIVVASDGQNTNGLLKRLDAKKISFIRGADGYALVAESGSSELSQRAVEILKSKATGKPITDYRTLADLAEEAVKEVRAVMISNYASTHFSIEEFQRYLRDNWAFSLMLAYYCDNKPYIFTIDNIGQFANKCSQHYSAMGCGGDLGMYLLSEFAAPQQGYATGLTTSVYVVEKVKQNINGCDGMVQIGMIYPTKTIKSFQGSKLKIVAAWIPQENIQKFSKGLASVEEVTKMKRTSLVTGMLAAIAKQEEGEIHAELKRQELEGG
jgi:20S proteasome alpha/beta subunit